MEVVKEKMSVTGGDVVHSQNQHEIYLVFRTFMRFNEFTLTFVSYHLIRSLERNGSLERIDCRKSSRRRTKI